MDVFNRVHIRKIQVEIAKIYVPGARVSILREEHQARREKIRKSKMFSAAATLIQAVFRGYRARKELYLIKEIVRVKDMEKRREELVIERGSWWMDREIPVHLPPIKCFGRKRDHLTTKGWGHWEGNQFVSSFPELEKKKLEEENKKISLSKKLLYEAKAKTIGYNTTDTTNELKLPILPPVTITKLDKNIRVMSILNPDDPAEDNHPTRIFTDRLHKTGYDRRREQKFKGEKVDIFIPQPIIESLNLDV